MPDIPESEWRELVITEIRELRSDFLNFKVEMARDQGERKGRQTILAAVVSTLVSMCTALAYHLFKGPSH